MYFAKNLKYLRKERAVNQDEIADIVKKSPNTISNWENEVSEPNLDELSKIINFFEVKVEDMLFADLSNVDLVDEMKFNKIDKKGKVKGNVTGNLIAQNTHRTPTLITVDHSGNENIIFVPVRARAGYLAGYEDPEFIQTLPTYSLPNMHHGTHRMFEIYGHSMIPTFNESDIIIGRYVENLLEIRDDRIYVVVTKRDGVVVKRVLNRVHKEGKLILNSDNQKHTGDYPPIICDPDDVLEVWYAVAYMSRQMRAPAEMYTRLLDHEARLALVEDSFKKGLKQG